MYQIFEERSVLQGSAGIVVLENVELACLGCLWRKLGVECFGLGVVVRGVIAGRIGDWSGMVDVSFFVYFIFIRFSLGGFSQLQD